MLDNDEPVVLDAEKEMEGAFRDDFRVDPWMLAGIGPRANVASESRR